MKITELLTKETIIVDLKSTTKVDVIDELTNKLDKAGILNDKEEFKSAIWKRENEFSTGIGEGIAIPHAKTTAVKTPALAFGRSKSGIDYDSLDGNSSYIFFMIAASEGAHNEHLDTLSRLSSMLMHEGFREKLMTASSEEEILSLIDSEENGYLKEEKQNVTSEDKESKALILAVTACPTGIAHTYMAADALKNKAKDMGIDIKIETNGSTGVKNILTNEEIEKAATIIVAVDKQVEMSRFEGKKLIQVPLLKLLKSQKNY